MEVQSQSIDQEFTSNLLNWESHHIGVHARLIDCYFLPEKVYSQSIDRNLHETISDEVHGQLIDRQFASHGRLSTD